MTRALPLAAAAALLLLGPAANAEDQQRVRILAPEPDSYLSGPIVIRAAVEPAGTAVARISFFADGRLVCVVSAPPFDCAWDAGAVLREHAIRVVAETPAGARLRATVRTRDAGYVERVRVDAVQVTVTVMDRSGNLIRELPRDHFSVREDGTPQTISAFASSNIPLELVTALDVSQSMSHAMEPLKRAARAFLHRLRPADQVTLLAFNDNIFTLARRSTDPPGRLRAVDRLAPWGGTALHDALLMALNMVGREPGRRSLVVFTDGEDQSSVSTLSRVETRMETSDATVYTIGLGRALQDPKLRGVLERIADVSGGRAFLTERPAGLDQAFAAIVEELSSQYLLAYAPTNTRRDGTWRRIEVDVRGDYVVRARRGYRAADGGTP